MRNVVWMICFLPAVTVSCLTADDRPPPGSLLVTVSPSDAVMQGVETVDGWRIVFSKAVVSIGGVGLGNRGEGLDTTCDTYSEARYTRVLNLLSGAGQKLSQQFALGQCDFGFRLGPPGPDALLGAGATEQDKILMRTPGTEPFVGNSGISLMTHGTATRNGESKSFQWVFRQTVRYRQCKLVQGGQSIEGVVLRGDELQSYDLRVEVERLFHDDLKDSRAQLRFDPFAAADVDSDGLITIEELAKVELDKIRGLGPYGMVPDPEGDAGVSDASDEDTGVPESGTSEAGLDDGGLGFLTPSLATYLYQQLLPTVPRFRGTGTCERTVGPNNHGDGFD
jgi:hypothetical protein